MPRECRTDAAILVIGQARLHVRYRTVYRQRSLGSRRSIGRNPGHPCCATHVHSQYRRDSFLYTCSIACLFYQPHERIPDDPALLPGTHPGREFGNPAGRKDAREATACINACGSITSISYSWRLRRSSSCTFDCGDYRSTAGTSSAGGCARQPGTRRIGGLEQWHLTIARVCMLSPQKREYTYRRGPRALVSGISSVHGSVEEDSKL